MGGPCYSTGWLTCMFSDSAYVMKWLDKSSSLPALNADPNYITLSGFSGGGGFATNFHVTNSDRVKAVGLMSSYSYAVGDYLTEPINQYS